jgi:hypothetical protein
MKLMQCIVVSVLLLTLIACGGNGFDLIVIDGGFASTPTDDAAQAKVDTHEDAQEAATQEAATPAQAANDARDLPDAGGWNGDSGSDSGVGSGFMDAGAERAQIPGDGSLLQLPMEAAIEASIPPTCDPTLPMTSAVCGPYGVDTPMNYCLLVPNGQSYGGGMPRECQCAGTYTCGCLMARNSNPCLGSGSSQFVSCAVDSTSRAVTVTCR